LLGDAAVKGKGLGLGFHHHFLRFPRERHHKHFTTIGQAKMRHFDGLNHAMDFNRFLAPIELADLTGLES
jgi:hypothetical protein